MLKKETLIGVTVGQLLAIIGLIGGIFASWNDTKTDIAMLQVDLKNTKEIRVEDARKIDDMSKKIDKIYEIVLTKK